MYLIIGVRPIHQPYKRKLWRSLKQNEEPGLLEFTRVVFGIKSSPFHAQFVSREHTKKEKPELPDSAETVFCPSYIDDSMDCKRRRRHQTIPRFFKMMGKRWYVGKEMDAKFSEGK